MIHDGNFPTLRALIEIATPYVECSYVKEHFLQNITPELEEQFVELYTEEFEKAMEAKGLYFIVNYPKSSFVRRDPSIRLFMCGRDELPTIALTL